jgi:hypothetical protein
VYRKAGGDPIDVSKILFDPRAFSLERAFASRGNLGIVAIGPERRARDSGDAPRPLFVIDGRDASACGDRHARTTKGGDGKDDDVIDAEYEVKDE